MFNYIPHIGSAFDEQTTVTSHFSSHIGIQVRLTDKLRFISSSNWNIRITDRRTNYVSFHPSYSTRSKIDGHTTVYFTSYWNIRKTNRRFSSLLILSFRQTDRQTRFYFTPNIGIFAKQTDKLRYISSLILEPTQDRRTDYISFYP